MATIPIGTDSDLIREVLTSDEIKGLSKRGLFLDTEFWTLWTKTEEGEMVPLGGGKAVDITTYPGIGERLNTLLPITDHVKNGQPVVPVEVLNHLYARATSKEVPVRNPRVIISNVIVDKEAELITLDVEYIDFTTLYRSNAILSTADDVPGGPLDLGNILDLPEQIVSPTVRTVTVPLLEFSDVRNRIMVTAYTELDEYLESNRITLDVAPIPIPPGEITVNSGEFTAEGLLQLNITQLYMDYTRNRGVEIVGTEGYEYGSESPEGQHPEDGTFDITYDYDYKGVGEIQVRAQGYDLNGDEVLSPPFYVRIPNTGIRVKGTTYDPVDNIITVTVTGEDLDTTRNTKVYLRRQYNYSSSYGTLERTVLENGDVECTVYAGIGNHEYVTITVNAPAKDGSTVELFTCHVLKTGTEKTPTLDLNDWTVSQVLTGEVLSVHVETADTEDGLFTPLNAIYGTPYVDDVVKLPVNGKYSPYRGHTWIRPVVVYSDRVERGEPVFGLIDFVNVTDDLRQSPEDGFRTVINVPTFGIEFPVEADIIVEARPLASTDEADYIQFQAGKYKSRQNVPLDDLLAIGQELTTRITVKADDTVSYVCDERITIINGTTYPDIELTIDEIVFDSKIGLSKVTGSSAGLDRPTKLIPVEINRDIEYPRPYAYVTWTGNRFVAYISIFAYTEEHGIDFKLRALPTDTVNGRGGDSNVITNIDQQTGHMRISSVGLSLSMGKIMFNLSQSDLRGNGAIDKVTATDSEGTTFELGLSGGSSFFTPDWITGDITYTVYCTLRETGLVVSDSITLASDLPHVDNSPDLKLDNMAIDHQLLHIKRGATFQNEQGDVPVGTHYRVAPYDSHRGTSITEPLDRYEDDVYDYSLKIMSPGMYRHEARFVVNHKVHRKSVDIEYKGPNEVFELVDSKLNGDLIIRPKLMAEGYPTEYIGSWYLQNNLLRERIYIGHPNSYTDEDGNRGARIPNYAIQNDPLALMYRTVDRVTYYAKAPSINPDMAPRVVEIQQAGRFLEVQWRLRADTVNRFNSSEELLVRVTDSSNIVSDYPLTGVTVDEVNLNQIELNPDVAGLITVSVIAVIDGKETLPYTYQYLLNDEPYVAIVGVVKKGHSTTLLLQSNKVTTAGEYWPLITAIARGVEGEEILLENERVNFNADTALLEISVGFIEAKKVEVIIDYWPSEGTLIKRTISHMVNPSREVKWVNIITAGSTGGTVTATGHVFNPNNSGIYALHCRNDRYSEWSTLPYELSRSSIESKDGSVALEFVRTSNTLGPVLDNMSAYRVATNGPDGFAFSETFNLSEEMNFTVTDVSESTGEHGEFESWGIALRGRLVKPKTTMSLLDANGLLLNVAGDTSLLTPEMGNVGEYVFSTRKGEMTLPITLRTVDMNDEFVFATYPHDAVPNAYPSELTIRNVKYVTSDDGESVAVYAEINLPLMDTATAVIAIPGAPAVSITDVLTEMPDGSYSLLYTVDDNNLSSFTVTVIDQLGSPWSELYAFTGEEVTEGDWGVIPIPPSVPLPGFTVSRTINTIRDTFKGIITFTLVDERFSYDDIAYTVRYTDDPEVLHTGTVNMYKSGMEDTIEVDLLPDGTREVEIIMAVPDSLETYIVNYAISDTDAYTEGEEEFPVVISDVAFTLDPVTNEKRLYFVVESSWYMAGTASTRLNGDPLSLYQVGGDWGPLDNRYRWISRNVTSFTELSTLELSGYDSEYRDTYLKYEFTGEEPIRTLPTYDNVDPDSGSLYYKSGSFGYKYDIERDVDRVYIAGTGHLVGNTYSKAFINGVEKPVSNLYVSSSRDKWNMDIDITERNARFIHIELKREDGTFLTLSMYLTAYQVTEAFPTRLDDLRVSYVVNQITDEHLYTCIAKGINHYRGYYVTNDTDRSTSLSDATVLPNDEVALKLRRDGSSLLEFIRVFNYDDGGSVATHVFGTTEVEVIPDNVMVTPSKVEFFVFESGLTEIYIGLNGSNILADTVRITTSDNPVKVEPTTPLQIFEGKHEIGHEVSGTDITSIRITMLDVNFVPHVLEYTITGEEPIIDENTVPPIDPNIKSTGDFNIRNVNYLAGDILT